MSVEFKREGRSETLFVNGEKVSIYPAEVEYFKKHYCPNVEGKRVLMAGLGLGYDMLYCLAQGASKVTVVEIEQGVIGLFFKRYLPFARMEVVCSDWFTYEYNEEDYDVIIYSIDKYEIIKGDENK